MYKDVIIFGDDPTGHTGFGKIVDHLVDACLELNLKPIVVGLKHKIESDYKVPIVNCFDKKDSNGWATLEETLTTTKARSVITIGDPWDIHGIVSIKNRIDFIWVGYTPVESPPYPRWILLNRNPNAYLDVGLLLSEIDYIVPFTQFGELALSKMISKYNKKTKKKQIIPVSNHIYLGVDTSYFNYYDKIKAKENLNNPLIESDTILFTCTKANTFRVGFDNLLEAWKLYLDKVDPTTASKSKLYLHTDLAGNGYPIPLLIDEIGLSKSKSVIIDSNIKLGVGYPIEQIRNLYHATDVFVSTARGEGFGLPIAEAMACKVPCIVPDYAAPGEYMRDGGIKIPIAAYFQPEFSNTKFAILDINEMANQMARLAKQPELRKTIGDKARNTIKHYTWKLFVEKWKPIISEANQKALNIKYNKIHLEYV